MLRSLKPVDQTPICDPAYLRRIDPVWTRGPVPPRFWEDGAHRRDYLLSVADQLGFRTTQDFYRLQFDTRFWRANHGAGLHLYWHGSALAAVRDCFFLYDWKPWLFRRTPDGFWDSPANQRSYLDWLGRRLGYRSKDDWYQVTLEDFLRNRGRGLMARCHASPARAVIGLIPARNWCEWKFRQVSAAFWDAAENRRRYLRWLGKELGFRRPEDWYRIRTGDLAGRHGAGLLHRSSLYEIMREFLPELNWDQVDEHFPMRVQEILAWADAYRARHGRWPVSEPEVVPESGRTWRSVDSCLKAGLRGLRGGTSLAMLLEKKRGVPVGRVPPKLSEKQILLWADAHFAAQGKWPTRESGLIPGSRETWSKVASALDRGLRGLRSGCSLARFLARRRGRGTVCAFRT